MNILIICPYFHPYENPRSFRWTAIAKNWAEMGHRVSIVSAKWSKSPIEIHPDCTVFPVAYASVWHYFRRNKPNKTKTIHIRKTSNNFSFKTLTLGILHGIWRKLYWPDGSALWIRPAKKIAMDILKREKFDTIYTVSIPFSSHVVGYYCKKHHPDLKWIMDAGDPFAFAEAGFKNNHSIFHRKNLRAEKKYLSKAHKLAVTTKNLAEKYQYKFSEDAHKLAVIPPLLHQRVQEYYIEKPSNSLRFIFIGSFYRGLRSPKQTLSLFDQFLSEHPDYQDKISLAFYGQIEDSFLSIFKSFPRLENILEMNASISRNEIKEVYKQAGVILNIGNVYPSQIPSKVVEYLASGLPILNIQSAKRCASADFFDSIPSAVNIPPEGYARFKAFLLDQNKRTLSLEEVRKLASPYRVRLISEAYLRLI